MNKVFEFISTGFYIGYFPVAPGTWGSLTATLIAWNLHQSGCSRPGFVIVTLVVFILGIISVEKFLKNKKEKDPGYVVIDEWAGQFAVFSLVPASIESLIAGFFLFRFFDITKFYPINKSEKLKGAYGIMVDDLIAGLYAGISLLIIHLFIWRLDI